MCTALGLSSSTEKLNAEMELILGDHKVKTVYRNSSDSLWLLFY